MVRPVQERDTGLRPFYEPEDPKFDIIAIHGIGAHPDDTWVQKTEDGTKINWLQNHEMLPAIVPNARIMRYGYPSAWFGSEMVSARVLDIASSLLRALQFKRQECSDRPIIFIAHCFGGVVLMRALSLSSHLKDDRRKVFESTMGIAFFSTPFRGTTSDFTSRLVAAAVAKYEDEVDTSVLQTLGADDQLLEGIMTEFDAVRNEPNPPLVSCFTETVPSNIGALTGGEKDRLPYVVSPSSGRLDGVEKIVLNRNHFNINKFESRDHQSFQEVEIQIRAMVKATPGLMRARKEYTGDLFKVAFSLENIPTTDRFIGRESQLKKLEEFLNPMRDGRKVFLLHGLGGIGKTQLAVKFARDFHSRYSAVFWLDGSTKSNLKDSFSRMLRRMPDYSSSPMGESIGNEQDKEIDAIQHWLSMPGNKHWLIIIDNVDYDQSNPKDSKSYDLDEYLPRAEHGSILITSRFRSVGQRFEDLQVDSVTDQEACAILNANARSPTPRDSNYWRPLINRLEGLPLALALAGSYIGQLGMSVNDYLDLYNSSWPELVNEHEPRQDYKGRTLLTTWQISVERAKGKDHVVEDLLKVWAVLDRNDIWSQLFAFKPSSKSSLGSKYPSSLKELRMNPLVFQRAMKVLLDLSLIVRSEDESSFSMHPVVHAWCKSLISNQEEPDIYRIAATIIYMHDQCEDLAQKLRIRRHALPVAEYYSKSPRSPRKYLLSLGRFLAGYQDFGLATPMITMAAKKYEGKQDFDKVLQCYEVLHESYGKLTMAEKRNEVYQKACQTYKTIRAQNSGQSTIRAHIRMGQIHNNRTNLKEAAKAYQRAIKECKANGENSYSRERLAATCCLAMIYRGERKYGQAERLLVPALDFAQTTLSESNTRTKTIRSLLSATYISMGNIDAAKAIFEKILKETPDDMSFIDRCFLGSLYLKTGLLNEARSLLESSHEKWTSSFIRPNEVSYGSALQLSHLYCATGNPTKAIKILRSVLEIDEQRLPSLRTMETATATLRLAIALSRQGESSQDVANLFDWAIEALGSLERPCYRPVLVMSTRFELFRWQMCENRIQDAEKTLETLFHKYFQPLNRDVLVLYLACIVADLGNKMQFGTAEKLQELVVQNLAKVYGPKSRMLLDANKNLEQVKSWGQNWTSGKEFRCGIVRYSCHHIGLQETTSERVGSLRECRQEDVERPYKGWRQVVAALALILYACGFTAVVSAIPFLDARIPERAYLWLAVNYGDLSMSFAQTLFQLSEERCPSHDTEPWLGEPVSGRHAWSIGERGNRAVSHQKS